jgi:hypothetical protein
VHVVDGSPASSGPTEPTPSERASWVPRLRAFVASGPQALPDPTRLYRPSATDVAGVLLPLVARRTLKRLLVASARLRAPTGVAAAWDRLVGALLELPDAALEALFVRAEVTGLVAGVEGNPNDGAELLPWLGQVVVGAVAAHGGDLPPTPVARSTPRSVALPVAAIVGTLDHAGTEPVVATVRAGQVVLASASVGWQPLPRLAGRVGISTGPDAWLERTFQGIEQVPMLDAASLERFVRSLDDAAAVLRVAWPEAHDELWALLRWVVPLASLDSWYVPGTHGLVALGIHAGRRQVRDLFHETCHHKLSRVLELASAATNPAHLVRSPFAKEPQPVTSLLQSCWAFAREHELIARLEAIGYIEPAAIAREKRKFRAFFDKGIPVLRREARLTALGEAVLTSIEEAIA